MLRSRSTQSFLLPGFSPRGKPQKFRLGRSIPSSNYPPLRPSKRPMPLFHHVQVHMIPALLDKSCRRTTDRLAAPKEIFLSKTSVCFRKQTKMYFLRPGRLLQSFQKRYDTFFGSWCSSVRKQNTTERKIWLNCFPMAPSKFIMKIVTFSAKSHKSGLTRIRRGEVRYRISEVVFA